MHAFLFIGENEQKVREKALKKAGFLGEVLEYNITNISDVRELGKFTKLAFKKPTSFLIENIDVASPEALNAFLKNLEEPQENVNYVLTATSEYSTLPTIVSRCQVIRVNAPVKKDGLDGLKFFNSEKSEKLKIVSQIKNRDEARRFLKNTILGLHESLVKNGQKRNITRALKFANDTLRAIEKNANIGLQLTNFAINLR